MRLIRTCSLAVLVTFFWSLAAEAAERTYAYPAAASSLHEIVLGGETVPYRATAGSMVLRDGAGQPLGDMVYVAYSKIGSDPSRRPITFVWGGGPGAAVGTLMMRLAGPRVIVAAEDHLRPSTSPALRDNPDSWLAFTDLVFVDPVGTGFSRPSPGKTGEEFWGWKKDIDWLSRFVALYLVEENRLASPKYLAGESYGGFRTPQVARRLQDTYSVGVAGIIMLSPVIDFSLRLSHNGPLDWATRLPVMAAARIERDSGTDVDIAALQEAESYAFGDYLIDLMRPRTDVAAQARLTTQVSRFTGLDPELVRRMTGRVDPFTFNRELRRESGLVGSRYDASTTAYDPWPERTESELVEPIEGEDAPVASAVTEHITRELGWRPPVLYTVFDRGIAKQWDYPSGRVDASPDLRAAMAIDPRLEVFVAHGATDFVTPWLASRIIFDQMPPAMLNGRVKRVLYPGGHAFYERPRSRMQLLRDLRSIYPGPQH